MESEENQLESSSEETSVILHQNVNENQNQNENENESEKKNKLQSEALAKALSATLSSVIKEFDSKAEQTLSSQDHLSQSLDRLTRELDKLLEDAPLPFIMQHAAKISVVRKRVSSLNSVLKSVQRRLDNIDRMLFVGVPHHQPQPQLEHEKIKHSIGAAQYNLRVLSPPTT